MAIPPFWPLPFPLAVLEFPNLPDETVAPLGYGLNVARPVFAVAQGLAHQVDDLAQVVFLDHGIAPNRDASAHLFPADGRCFLPASAMCRRPAAEVPCALHRAGADAPRSGFVKEPEFVKVLYSFIHFTSSIWRSEKIITKK